MKKPRIAALFRYTFCLLAPISFLTTGCTKKNQKTLNVATWANYLSDEVMEKFKQETGITVQFTYFSANEELLAKVQNGKSGIDLALPSDYLVAILKEKNLLAQLKNIKINNIKNIHSDYLDLYFDRGNEVSLPFARTTTGIAINRDLIQTSITTWAEFFRDPKLKGKVAVLDDMRELIGAALLSEKKSVNSVDVEDLASAEKLLLKFKSHIKVMSSDSVDLLKNKEVAIAQTYSVDALQAKFTSGLNIDFINPMDGGISAVDNFVILKESKKINEAVLLIDFLLKPEIYKSILAKNFGGSVSEPLKDNGKKQQNLIDLAEKNQLYEKIWLKIKGSGT